MSHPSMPAGLELGEPLFLAPTARPHAHTISEVPRSATTSSTTPAPPTIPITPGPPVSITRDRADTAPAAIDPGADNMGRLRGNSSLSPPPSIVLPRKERPNGDPLSPLRVPNTNGNGRDRSASIASSSIEDVQGDSNVPATRQKEFEKHFGAKLGKSKSKSALTSPSTSSLSSSSTASPSDDYLTVLSTRAADLQASILIHGRLYLTRHHLCFRSNILGIKTVNVHPLSSLIEVRPGTTAKFIQNAVYIRHEGEEEKTGYGSMSDRDGFLEVLMACWKVNAPEAYDSYTNKVEPEETAAPVADADPSTDAPTASTSQTAAGGPSESTPPASSTQVKHTKDSGQRYKELALDTKLPVTPDQLFNLIYHTEAFTTEFMEKDQKLKEVNVTDWASKKRTLTYIMSITNPIGPSETHSTSTEEEAAADPEQAYEIVSETKNPDLPSGKNFSIKTRTCITHTDVNGKPGSRLVATTEVAWTGSSMLKGKITSASISGQKEYHQKLVKKLRGWIKAHPGDFGKVAGAEGADAGEAEDNAEEQYAEDTKEEMAYESSSTTEPPKNWEDHVSDILENPVMIAITALALTLLLLDIYRLLFGRSGKAVQSIRDHVDLVRAKAILSTDPVTRLDQLERLLGLEKVVPAVVAAAKAAKQAATGKGV